MLKKKMCTCYIQDKIVYQIHKSLEVQANTQYIIVLYCTIKHYQQSLRLIPAVH